MRKKLIVSFLIFIFIIYPIIQIKLQIDISYAATYSRTIDLHPSANINGYLRKGEYVAKKENLTRYKHEYSTSFTMSNIIVDQQYKSRNYYQGAVILTSGKSLRITSITQTKLNKWTYKASYSGRLYGSELTNYTKTKPSPKKITILSNYDGFGGKTLTSNVIVNDYICRYTIYMNPTSTSNSSNNKPSSTTNNSNNSNKPSSTPNNSSNNNNKPSSTTSSTTNNAQSNAQSNSFKQPSYNTPTDNSYTNGNTITNQISKDKQRLNNVVDIGDDSKRLFIRYLYKMVLGREPRAENIEGHLKKTPQQIAIDIILSQESQKINNVNNISNEYFTQTLYVNILQRKYDSAGWQNNITRLNNGFSRSELIKYFVTSDEFKKLKSRETINITLDEKLCNAVYQDLLTQGYEVVKKNNTTLLMYKQDMEKVTSLNLSGKEISNLTGLSNFKNVNTLNLQNNNLTSVAMLKDLTKLKKLNLSNNKLNENSDYTSLVDLEELNLNSVGMTGTGVDFSGLTKIKILYLNNNKLTTVRGLDKLTNLKQLYLDNNEISNLDFVNNLQLEKFSVKNNVIVNNGTGNQTDLPDIIKSAKVQNSKVYTSNNYEISGGTIENGKLKINNKTANVKIKGGNADGTAFTYNDTTTSVTIPDKVLAKKIEEQLGENNILSKSESNGACIFNISKAKVDSVSNLDLSSTKDSTEKITSLKGLEAFSNITTINLNYNKVEDLQLLGNLKQLTTLSIRHNELTDLNSLKDVTTLIQLDASNNKISDISAIANMKDIQNVVLANNLIKNNLKPLSGLEKLSVLDISNNVTSDISSLGNNLTLTKFYASQNYIENIDYVNNNSGTSMELKNNIIFIIYNDTMTRKKMPSILKYAIENDGGLDNLDLKFCTIEGDYIVFNNLKMNATITIKEGKFKGTTIEYQNDKYLTRASTKVEYERIDNGKKMKVTIKSDRKLAYMKGWEWANSKEENPTVYEYVATYDYNIKNQGIKIRDINGCEAIVFIDFEGIENEVIPGLTVSYSNSGITDNQTVTISSSEKLHLYDADNSMRLTLSEDGYSITGSTGAINQDKIIMLQSDYEKYFSEGYYDHVPRAVVNINATNVDKMAPVCTVEYSEVNPTSNAVIATIWSDEPIFIDEQEKYEGIVVKNSTENDGIMQYGTLLYYIKNKSETITVKDIFGHTAEVPINIENIDSEIDNLKLQVNGIFVGSNDSTVNISADENIRFTDEMGRTREISAIAMYAGPKVRAINTGNNQLSFDVTEGDIGAVAINDDAGNTDVSVYSAGNVDKTCPCIIEQTEYVNEDGSKLVTIKFDEPIEFVNGISNWTISEDAKTITRVFKADSKETLTLKDLAGNEGKYDVIVENIEMIEYSIQVEALNEGLIKQYLITITADRPIQEVDGWTLLEDGKSIIKVVGSTEYTELLNIMDSEGNSSKVYVELSDIEIYDEDNEGNENNKDNEENNNDNKNQDEEDNKQLENTEYKYNIPQAGSTIILEITIALLIIVTIVILDKYKKYKKI